MSVAPFWQTFVSIIAGNSDEIGYAPHANSSNSPKLSDMGTHGACSLASLMHRITLWSSRPCLRPARQIEIGSAKVARDQRSANIMSLAELAHRFTSEKGFDDLAFHRSIVAARGAVHPWPVFAPPLTARGHFDFARTKDHPLSRSTSICSTSPSSRRIGGTELASRRADSTLETRPIESRTSARSGSALFKRRSRVRTVNVSERSGGIVRFIQRIVLKRSRFGLSGLAIVAAFYDPETHRREFQAATG